MTNASAIRWGVLGTGWVAQRFMADLRAVPHAQIAAVASRDEERARSVATRFGAARSHASYEALAADPGVDVVYVASEHHEHAAHALLSLNHGKHVLCEKPFSTSLADTERVLDAAREAKRFCMEGMWTRFLPAARAAKRYVDGGTIGRPQLLSADFGIPVQNAGPNRFFDPARGGGALLDRGVYAISIAVWLFGSPTQIIGVSQQAESGVDETSAAILKFSDGRIATIAASLGAYSSNELVVAGSTGRLRMGPLVRPDRVSVDIAPVQIAGAPREDLQPQSVRELTRRVVARARTHLPLEALRSNVSRIQVRGYGYGYEAEEVGRCVRERLLESPLMPHGETMLVARVVAELQNQNKAG